MNDRTQRSKRALQMKGATASERSESAVRSLNGRETSIRRYSCIPHGRLPLVAGRGTRVQYHRGVQQYRKTRRRFERCGDVRFLTFSCFQRLPLFNNDAIKDTFVEHIAQSRQRTEFQLTAWVIMPEHVHLMLIPNLPDHPVSDVLSDLKSTFSRTVLQRWRSLNAPILSCLNGSRGKARFWQVGGGYDRNIITPEEYEEKLYYIHNNPVTRGLVQSPTDWRWSSARWYSGIRDGELAIDPFSF